ncbi:PH domain-containing protein [Arthrobacter sp. Soil763]|uniref:PH domain-containing protein n=1 Tax=Arthrobacter sp. Soil763 TaxID=1736402 RepID=UPI0007004277|nr:PH domain-containing protein [Arthrobacter sp. Soil763]KRE77422.1 hypothetical protein ASG71_14025 [Arthrobacter sp. Soil763]
MRKELFPGEQVIVVTRPQPRTLIAPALVFILISAATAFACAWILRGGPARLVPAATPEWTPWLLGACLALAGWVLLAYCLPRVLAWHASRYTLTSQRLIARHGLWRRRDQQVPLGAVRNVVVEQTLLQRSLRSGTISLETGHPGGAVIPDVPEVMTFRDFILDAIEELPQDDVPGGDALHGPAGWPDDRREGGRDER